MKKKEGAAVFPGMEKPHLLRQKKQVLFSKKSEETGIWGYKEGMKRGGNGRCVARGKKQRQDGMGRS